MLSALSALREMASDNGHQVTASDEDGIYTVSVADGDTVVASAKRPWKEQTDLAAMQEYAHEISKRGQW